MQNHGDALHDLFQQSLVAHRGVAAEQRDGALVALDLLRAEGHDTVGVGPITEPSERAFDRLELLAWRRIDAEQDRFATALRLGERDEAVQAVDRTCCFLDLLTELRVAPAADLA